MASRHNRISGLIAVLIAAPLASPLAAQGVSAQLSGTVKAQSGAAVAGATVVIRNSETGFVRTVQTDAAGRYLAPSLPVGNYSVNVTKPGFQNASNIKISLNLGDAAPLNVKLAPESSTTVEVVASESKIDSERSAVAATVSPTELANLPIKGRSLLDFSSLTPQVAVTGRGQVAIAGSRGVNTSINIDGGDYNSSFFAGSTGTSTVAGSPFSISMEAIREFQVVTDGASAEYGRMGGGFLNAITKSGTNELAGGLFFYHRPSTWVAKEVNVSGKPGANDILDFKTQQYGGSLGGPIIKDKLFYFVAFDFQREKRPQQFTWGGSTAINLNPSNPSDAVLISKAGSFTKPNDGDNLFLRMDWNVSTDHTLQLRMTKSSIKSVYQNTSFASAENTANDEYNTTAIGLQWNWVLGPNWLSELKVNYNKDEQPRVPKTYSPQVSIGSGVGVYGKVPFTRQFELKKTQVTETVSYFTPTFQVKAGVDYIINNVFEVFAPFVEGSYTFNASGSVSSIDNFRAGNWTSYQQNVGLNGLSGYEAGRFDQKENEYALFIQTDWRATSDVKVGLGLRYDKQEHPDFPILDVSNPLAANLPITAKIPQSSNLSPRLSLTWTPSADKGNTVVRFSAGRYVSRTPSIFLYQAFTGNGARVGAYTFQSSNSAQLNLAQALGIARGSGFNPGTPATIPATAFDSLTPAQLAVLKGTLQVSSFSGDFKNPVTDRLSLGVERAFGSGWVLGATGTYAKSENLERITDVNLAETSVNAQGRPQLTRPNPNYGAIKVYVSDAYSRYKALTLSAKYQKAESPFSGQIFYTLSEAKDTDSNERNFNSYAAQNPLRPDEEYGYGDNDQRHVIVGNMAYLESFTKLQFGATLRYYSALPYTPLFTSDRNGDFNNNDRLLGSARNSSRTASQTNVDLRISRDWTFNRYRLTTSIDVFNLLNHADTYQRLKYSGTDAAPVQGQDFRTLTFVDSTLFPTRQVQVGLRLAF
ncbi:MAG: TonB-dependent receptor [Acidobacteriota bacterium]|nr:TonB-dependent receptor [Acidobacteriota bacterium]